jgi:hypothetical protein
MKIFSPAGQDGIFISYRTSDVEWVADRLHSRLTDHFSSRQVFFAPEKIPLAVRFVDVINDRLRSCRVFLALIGEHWRPGLHNPGDYVRMEIETALALPNVTVVPVLIDGAKMPPAHEVPDRLAQLTDLEAFQLSRHYFDLDADRLAKWLNKIVPRRVLVVAPMALVIPLLVLAMHFTGVPLDRHWTWIALVGAILGAVVAAVDFRRSAIWVVAIETALIWCIAYIIYRLNIGHIRHLLPLSGGISSVSPGAKYLAVICGAAAIIFVSLLLVLARRFRRGKRVVHVLLALFLACMAAGLGLKTFGYISHKSVHASGWILLAALVANISAPLVALRRKLDGLGNNPPARRVPTPGARTAVRPPRADWKQGGV